MHAKQSSWLGRLFNGRAMEQRIAELEAELKVRTDIMNITSIVSEADKKGDILSVNEKFLAVSKYPKNELIGFGHNTTRHPDMPNATELAYKGAEQDILLGPGHLFSPDLQTSSWFRFNVAFCEDAEVFAFLDKQRQQG